MPVLFTAIEIPTQLQPMLLSLRPDSPLVKKTGALHITLHFIGNVPDDKVDDINSALSTVTASDFTQKLSGSGVFTNKNRPHFLWVGVEKSKEIIELHHRVGQSLLKQGIELELRPYLPHVTVGKLEVPDHDLVDSFIGQNEKFELSFDVKSFCLYSSERNAQEPLYRKIATHQIYQGQFRTNYRPS